VPKACSLTFASFFAAAALAQAAPAQHRVATRVDPRIELVTAVARLAGFAEFNMPNSRSPYADEVEARFAALREHAAVAKLKELRAARGVSHDALASFALHLDGIEELGELVPFDAPPERLDKRWSADGARAFASALRDFAAQGKAAEFFASKRELFAEVEKRLAERLSQSKALDWFDAFFGARPGAQYVAVAGLLCGGGNFGAGVRFPDGRPEEITPVFGCWVWDERGLPVFGEAYLPLFVHELCHSYTNPVVDRHARALESAGKRIQATCAEKMRKQSYGTWQSIMNESLVRASVVRCRLSTEGKAAAEQQARDELAAGFAWVPELAKLLDEYETQRAQFASFDDFVPRVVAFHETWAGKLEELERARPHVVSIEPRSGASDVDPAAAQLVVRFDRAMRDQSWSIVGSKENTPAMTGAPKYDAERKTLTVPMQLEPGKTYRFSLNGVSKEGFKSAEGVPLEPYEVTFTTRG
jgi:hypothetical protein